jgi:formylglycine-generating enzyme required for sulfatase activity
VKGRAIALASTVVACIAGGCTLVLGDGQYHVTPDAEADSGASYFDVVPEGDAENNGGDAGSCVPDACATGTCLGGSCTGVTATAPSCADGGRGRSNCGPGGTDSCCMSAEIPGGTYDRTFPSTGPSDPATVEGFRLDVYLVTVGRFREFVSELTSGSWTPQEASGKHAHLNGGRGLANAGNPGTYEDGWAIGDNMSIVPTSTCSSYATWTTSPGAQENLPINCLNWYTAYAFCIWDGGFLPSEAEYEYAAAAGGQQREYPWGTAAPGTTNQFAIYGDGKGACYYPNGSACTGVANIAPVGTPGSGAGLWGQLDLAGNLSEWNLDWYKEPYVNPCTDCAYLEPTDAGRGLRGGSFKYGAFNLATAERYASPPSDPGDTFGVRCARVP